MYEVELKVRAAHDPVRDRLSARDADPVGTVEQVDTYFDAPHRDFAETDEALRVRRESTVDGPGTTSGDEDADAVAELTYKGPKVDADSKTRREVETAVASGDDAAAIVEALGFEPAAEVRKVRERYAVGDYTVTLDGVDGLGTFVEVETHAGDVDAARAGAADLLADLGLDPDDQIRTSYLGLLLAEE